jgi:predicted RNase H-like HicB family nuclease
MDKPEPDSRMADYRISTVWSDEDQAFVATCIEFSGLSGLSEKAEDAIAELQIALNLAIETYRGEGWELPAPGR